MSQTGILDIVHKYRDNGWYVMPINPFTKSPYPGNNGFGKNGDFPEYAFKDGDYVGFATGKRNERICIDIDLQRGGLDSWKQLGFFKSKVVDKTPNGVHLWYKYKDSPFIRNTKDVLPGIDIRTDGGYAVIPPSEGYEEAGDLEVTDENCPEFPQVVLVFLQAKYTVPTVIESRPSMTDALDNLVEGKRHENFARIIGKMNRDNWDQEFIFKLLKPHAEGCKFDLKELEKQVRSMKERYANQVQYADVEFGPADSILQTIKQPSFLIDTLLPKKALCLLVSDPKVGKSYLAMELALSLATGGIALGKYKATKGKVLYLALDDPMEITASRYRLFLKRYNVESVPDLHLIKRNYFKLDDHRFYSQLEAYITQYKPDLVVLDTFEKSHNLSDVNTQEILEILGKVQKLRDTYSCSVLLLHHFSGMGYDLDSAYRKIKGNTSIFAGVDHVVRAKKMRAEDGSFFVQLHIGGRFVNDETLNYSWRIVENAVYMDLI